MSDVPLIYTTKGNLPVDTLEYHPVWEETDDYIKFQETYLLDGEIVKQNAHVYAKRGLFGESVAQSLV